MGLFKKKKKKQQQAVPVGQAMCLVDADGWAHVNQQHHAKVDPDAIALLAPITFVVDEAARLVARGRHESRSWVGRAEDLARRGAADANSEHNPAGVAPLSPGSASPAGVAAWGHFTLTPASLLTGEWQRTSDYASGQHRERVLAALLAAAAWRNVEDALPHALEALANDSIDYANPIARTELPQVALDYGAHQAAIIRVRDAGPFGGE